MTLTKAICIPSHVNLCNSRPSKPAFIEAVASTAWATMVLEGKQQKKVQLNRPETSWKTNSSWPSLVFCCKSQLKQSVTFCNPYNLRMFATFVLHQHLYTSPSEILSVDLAAVDAMVSWLDRSHCKILAKLLEIMRWNGTQRSMIND